MVYKFSCLVLRLFFRLFFKLQIEGLNQVPAKGALIVASNHVSNFDPPFVAAFCPRDLNFLAKEELFKNFFSAIFFRMLCMIPLNRKTSAIGAIKTALKILKQDKGLALFPQGTRSASLDEFKSGVGFIAKRSRAAIVVAKIEGIDKILPKGAKWFKPGKIRLVFARLEGVNYDLDAQDIAAAVVEKIKLL